MPHGARGLLASRRLRRVSEGIGLALAEVADRATVTMGAAGAAPEHPPILGLLAAHTVTLSQQAGELRTNSCRIESRARADKPRKSSASVLAPPSSASGPRQSWELEGSQCRNSRSGPDLSWPRTKIRAAGLDKLAAGGRTLSHVRRQPGRHIESKKLMPRLLSAFWAWMLS